jgi:hypothetical protein
MNALERSIVEYQKQGWILISHTGTTAQLSKPKGSPSCALIVILFVLGILPGIIYLLLYNAKKEQIVTLFMDENGAVTRK